MALKIFTIIYFISIFAGVIFSLWLKMRKIPQDYLYVYLLVIFCAESFNTLTNNSYNFTFNFLDCFSILFVGLYVSAQIHSKRTLPRITYLLVLIALLISFLNFTEYYMWLGIFAGLVIVVFSFTYYYKIINVMQTEKNILTNPAFWFVTSMFMQQIFFLFRLVPRFYFQNADATFMENIRVFFLAVCITGNVLIIFSLYLYKNRIKINKNLGIL